ncbi:MAG: DUF3150 domain-containing protein [Thiomicrospira sp.]|nr:DUF3150 domain-containing protein [Thiomicrospira sp.]OIP95591.1 MAG: hypothetical protein AUK56_04920 [Thiomicrospira sp. CG2_30_44_34]
MTMTTTTPNNTFFEVRLDIFAGSTKRKALDKAALKAMGFNENELDEVKAVLSTEILPKKTFDEPLAIRKSVQEFLSTMGHNHPLVGRVFNPKDRVEIVNKLREKQKEYNDWTARFLASYEKLKKEQLEKIRHSAEAKGFDPEIFIDSTASAQPPKSYFENNLSFDFLDLSVQLDTEQWGDLIDRINSDLKEKTIYELSRDAAKVRDSETTRGMVSKLNELSDRLDSIDFYVKGSGKLAGDVRSLVRSFGGLKPSKEYSTVESLSLGGLAKVIEINSAKLIRGKASLSELFTTEAQRIELLLREDDEQMDIEDAISESKESKVSKVSKVSKEPKVSKVSKVSKAEDVHPKSSQATNSNFGAYAF